MASLRSTGLREMKDCLRASLAERGVGESGQMFFLFDLPFFERLASQGAHESSSCVNPKTSVPCTTKVLTSIEGLILVLLSGVTCPLD